MQPALFLFVPFLTVLFTFNLVLVPCFRFRGSDVGSVIEKKKNIIYSLDIYISCVCACACVCYNVYKTFFLIESISLRVRTIFGNVHSLSENSAHLLIYDFSALYVKAGWQPSSLLVTLYTGQRIGKLRKHLLYLAHCNVAILTTHLRVLSLS